jgi:hypothetical protein
MSDTPTYDEVLQQTAAPAHLRDDDEVVDGMPLLFRDGALEMEHSMPTRCVLLGAEATLTVCILAKNVPWKTVAMRSVYRLSAGWLEFQPVKQHCRVYHMCNMMFP